MRGRALILATAVMLSAGMTVAVGDAGGEVHDGGEVGGVGAVSQTPSVTDPLTLNKVALTGLAGTKVIAVADPPPVRIMTMGDSITCGANPCTLTSSYRAELGRLLDLAGVPYEFIVAAVAGAPCDYWSLRAWPLVEQYKPDFVLLNCGTNNFPGNATQSQQFEAVYRQLTYSLIAGSPTVKVIPSFIQYSDIGGYPNPPKAWSALATTEPYVNDGIYRATLLNVYWGTRIPAFADFQQIPVAYLDEGGIHPTESGYRFMARIWYEEMRPTMGWPALTGNDGMPCGRSGHRPGWGTSAFEPIRPGCPVL